MSNIKTYATPSGYTWSICNSFLQCPHLLIAGATGAGKSVLINSIMYSALIHSPARLGFVLIDLKRVELQDYKKLPHTLAYADNITDTIDVLKAVCNRIEQRYTIMQAQGIKRYQGTQIYVVIDEYADLVIKSHRAVEPFISDIAILGRAAGMHLIIATQRPTRDIIGGAIAANLESRVALRVATQQDSRNIIAVNGAECLPPHGVGLWRNGYKLEPVEIPITPEEDLKQRIAFWKNEP
jgi:S-DNA-T family DNA segregation ATPase FtsK/SpoIIIE